MQSLTVIQFIYSIQVSFINCAGYMIYGCVIKNPYIMCSVTLGLPVNYYAVSTAMKILGNKNTSLLQQIHDNDNNNDKDKPIDFALQIETIILCGIILWILVAFIIGSILPIILNSNDSYNISIQLIGNVCCTTSILYYISPLSVILDIINRKDARGLHSPLIILNLIATTMWSAYGLFYMNDVNIYAPNILAMCFSITQLLIKFYYPSSEHLPNEEFAQLYSEHSNLTDLSVNAIVELVQNVRERARSTSSSDFNPLHRERRRTYSNSSNSMHSHIDDTYNTTTGTTSIHNNSIHSNTSTTSSSITNHSPIHLLRTRRRTLSELLPVIHENTEIVPLDAEIVPLTVTSQENDPYHLDHTFLSINNTTNLSNYDENTTNNTYNYTNLSNSDMGQVLSDENYP